MPEIEETEKIAGNVSQVSFATGVGSSGVGQLLITLMQGGRRHDEVIYLHVGRDDSEITLDGGKVDASGLLIAMWLRDLSVVAWKRRDMYGSATKADFVSGWL